MKHANLVYISNKHPRTKKRTPLRHTLFYCQGALFPWPDKTCNQFQIQFFTIYRRHHSKWFGRYIKYISDHALTLKQTMDRPLIPDSYPFLARLHEVQKSYCSHPGRTRSRSRSTLLKFSRSLYLGNHSSESIHTWTIGTQ